jgi:hypothetical protein
MWARLGLTQAQHSQVRGPCCLATKERGVSRHLILCAITSLLMRATPLVSQEPHVSTQAPLDKPVSVTSDEQKRRLDAAVAPYVAQARATYPKAKQRYLAGLPPQQSFFVTVELRDALGRNEMASGGGQPGSRQHFRAALEPDQRRAWLPPPGSPCGVGNRASRLAHHQARWVRGGECGGQVSRHVSALTQAPRGLAA